MRASLRLEPLAHDVAHTFGPRSIMNFESLEIYSGLSDFEGSIFLNLLFTRGVE